MSLYLIGGLLGLLFVVLAVLRIAKVIAWSWWLVTLPLAVPALLFIAMCVFMAFAMGLGDRPGH